MSSERSPRAYRVAYDGLPFRGFQRQPDVPTVEGALFDALRALDVLAGEEATPGGYAAASRTDAGVSAVAQTVAFDAPEWLSPRALNAELPGTVRAWAAADVPRGFDATHHAVRRAYTYHLHAPDASVAAAADAVSALSGEHDFHNLTPDETGTVRELSGDVERDGAFLVLRFAAGGFPRQLVRRLVTVVESVATGTADRSRVERVLGEEELSGGAGVAAASPEPLVLTGVTYEDVTFDVDPEAAASARAAFGERRVTHRRRARAAGSVVDGVG